MGQGFYTGLAWGRVFASGDIPDAIEKWNEEMVYSYDKKLRIRSSYESEQPWFGVPICNDGQGSWHDADETLQYTAFAITDIPTKYAAGIEKARQVWEEARKACPELGEGQIILVADYD